MQAGLLRCAQPIHPRARLRTRHMVFAAAVVFVRFHFVAAGGVLGGLAVCFGGKVGMMLRSRSMWRRVNCGSAVKGFGAARGRTNRIAWQFPAHWQGNFFNCAHEFFLISQKPNIA